MKRSAAARRSPSETWSPTSPSGSVTLPDGLKIFVFGVEAVASAPNRPSSEGPPMSEMIAGGVFQAIHGRPTKLENDIGRIFMSVTNACWCYSRWKYLSDGQHSFCSEHAKGSACPSNQRR